MSEDHDDAIRCDNCGAHVAPTAVVCYSCGKQLMQQVGPTIPTTESKHKQAKPTESEPPPPDPDAYPPYMWPVNISAILLVVLIGIVWNFNRNSPDAYKILNNLMVTAREQLVSAPNSFWRRETSWPPPNPIRVVRVLPDDDRLITMAEDFVLITGAKVDKTTTLNWSKSDQEDRKSLLSGPPSENTLFIEADSRTGIFLKVTYWLPNSEIGNFRWLEEKSLFLLYARPVTYLIIVTFVCTGLRFLVIFRYRMNRKHKYEAYQRRLTQKRFAEKAQLDEARKLVTAGKLAQALVLLNELLEYNPTYAEAKELKRLVTMSDQAGMGSISQTLIRNRRDSFSAGSEVSLYLKVFGTPYAYRAETSAEVITLGRQRRKMDNSADVGNDVVIRVPASDHASLRISRRHIEIHRIGKEFFVIDKSGGNTKLNGRRLLSDEPFAIRNGDRLIIADVITLEVIVRPSLTVDRKGILCLEGPLRTGAGIEVEATLGDMVTEVPNE